MWASLICANLLRQLLVYVFSELLVYSFIQLFVICLLHPSQDLRPAVQDPKVWGCVPGSGGAQVWAG